MNRTLAVLLLVVAMASAEKQLIGQFRNYQHGIGGSAYAVDEQTIMIEGFEYDGAGPDAFFWAGTDGNRPGTVGIILPHPFNGKFYDYEDRSAPILEGRFNKKDITLTLPPGTMVSDLKWISVWCRAFQVNFGDIIFPVDFKLEEAAAESEPETTEDIDSLHPPLVHPTGNAHDPHHRQEEDADAESGYAEGEGEAESQAEAEAESAGKLRF
jgi:hypothetical protein